MIEVKSLGAMQSGYYFDLHGRRLLTSLFQGNYEFDNSGKAISVSGVSLERQEIVAKRVCDECAEQDKCRPEYSVEKICWGLGPKLLAINGVCVSSYKCRLRGGVVPIHYFKEG